MFFFSFFTVHLNAKIEKKNLYKEVASKSVYKLLSDLLVNEQQCSLTY